MEHRTLEEGKCVLSRFQEIEQGRHCLQGMPVSNASQPLLARLLSTLLGFSIPMMTRANGLNPGQCWAGGSYEEFCTCGLLLHR